MNLYETLMQDRTSSRARTGPDVSRDAKPFSVDIHLTPSGAQAGLPSRIVTDVFSAEHVRMTGRTPFEYAFTGSSFYLALHDIRRSDGETRVDGVLRVHDNDIRGKMTFLPPGCPICGWTAPARELNAFTALFFPTAALAEAVGHGKVRQDLEPRIYFEDDNLRASILKLEMLLRDDEPDKLHLDTLGLLIGIELLEFAGNPVQVGRGALSDLQARRVVAFIRDNVASNLSLADLAAVAGLSQFHFSRSFKSRFGTSPLQYVIQHRIEFARDLLKRSDLSIGQVGAAVGFKGTVQFSRTFARVTGVTPTEYRRSL